MCLTPQGMLLRPKQMQFADGRVLQEVTNQQLKVYLGFMTKGGVFCQRFPHPHSQPCPMPLARMKTNYLHMQQDGTTAAKQCWS